MRSASRVPISRVPVLQIVKKCRTAAGSVQLANSSSQCCNSIRWVSFACATGTQSGEPTAMAKKRSAKWKAWNKGLVLGQKDAFTPDQVKRIRRMLARRGGGGLRDLSLFSVAIDTMLQGPELLSLTVKDVRRSDGRIRSIIEVTRRRQMPSVRCALSKVSASALGKWITASGKKRT